MFTRWRLSSYLRVRNWRRAVGLDFVQFRHDKATNLTRFGVPTYGVLGKYQVAVHGYVENALAGGNQPPRADVHFDLAFTQNFVCQTDSA